MAIDTRRPLAQTPALPRPPAEAPERRDHRRLRGWLIGLNAFLALATISGAFVVLTLPHDIIKRGPFTTFTIPAIALGVICGGLAVVAAIGVALRPAIGAASAIAGGVAMIAFELVEIYVIGFTPVDTPSNPAAWLQVFFILFGVALIALGVRLWKNETGSYHGPLSQLLRNPPAAG